MLDPQVVVNLLPKLGVGVDLGHGNWLGEKIQVCLGTVPTKGLAESSTSVGAVSARHGQVKVLQQAARTCLRCARRRANSITLQRWRWSSTASSPLWVRVWVDFVIMQFFLFFLSED
jgi:hypothetical protein